MVVRGVQRSAAFTAQELRHLCFLVHPSAQECAGGAAWEAGAFRSSHRLPLRLPLLEMLKVLDWWHEAVLGMLLWATRVVSESGRLGARDRVAHLPACCRSTARPTRPPSEGALPDFAGPRWPRDGLRARPARHRDPP